VNTVADNCLARSQSIPVGVVTDGGSALQKSPVAADLQMTGWPGCMGPSAPEGDSGRYCCAAVPPVPVVLQQVMRLVALLVRQYAWPPKMVYGTLGTSGRPDGWLAGGAGVMGVGGVDDPLPLLGPPKYGGVPSVGTIKGMPL
jgi:hypothetical protein